MVTGPAVQTAKIGSPLDFSQSDGNALQVADGDAGNTIETVFVEVFLGTVAVANTAA